MQSSQTQTGELKIIPISVPQVSLKTSTTPLHPKPVCSHTPLATLIFPINYTLKNYKLQIIKKKKSKMSVPMHRYNINFQPTKIAILTIFSLDCYNIISYLFLMPLGAASGPSSCSFRWCIVSCSDLFSSISCRTSS